MYKIFVFTGLLACSSLICWGAKAETALEVQSWCKPFVTAKLGTNNSVARVEEDPYTDFCWGAFAMIQEFSRFVRGDGTAMIDICAPSDSTRIQFIKIFYKYVDDHPANAHKPFAEIAYRSLSVAFPCNRS
jgi:hypothetical protein